MYGEALGEDAGRGRVLSTKGLKVQAFAKTLKALHIPEADVAAIQRSLEEAPVAEVGGQRARRFFSEADLMAAESVVGLACANATRAAMIKAGGGRSLAF